VLVGEVGRQQGRRAPHVGENPGDWGRRWRPGVSFYATTSSVFFFIISLLFSTKAFVYLDFFEIVCEG
jgi:hypothetical protein